MRGAVFVALVLLACGLAGCTSEDDVQSTYMTIDIVDVPQKIGFNKQDQLVELLVRNHPESGYEWEDLSVELSIYDAEKMDEPLLTEVCLPPSISSAEAIEGSGPANVRINELMASNDLSYADPDDSGDAYDDWIELFNPGAEAMSLEGWVMTDAYEEYIAGGKSGHTFDQTVSIPAGGFLIVWADDETEQGPVHMNFKLKSEGETVSLINPQGEVHQNISWGAQTTDTSYTAVPDGSINFQVDRTPTPMRTNGVMSGENIRPESAPGSMGTGCMISQSTDDEFWHADETVTLIEDGVSLCGVHDSSSNAFPICYIRLTITHDSNIVLYNDGLIGLT